MSVKDIPATWQGMAIHNIENALFAIAITVAMKIPLEVIQKALQVQGMALDETPGRLNLYNQLPFAVVLDYALNAYGLNVLCQLTSKIDCKGKKSSCFFSGMRRDIKIYKKPHKRSQVILIVICRDSATPEQIYTGATADLLKSCLMQNGVAENNSHCGSQKSFKLCADNRKCE